MDCRPLRLAELADFGYDPDTVTRPDASQSRLDAHRRARAQDPGDDVPFEDTLEPPAVPATTANVYADSPEGRRAMARDNAIKQCAEWATKTVDVLLKKRLGKHMARALVYEIESRGIYTDQAEDTSYKLGYADGQRDRSSGGPAWHRSKKEREAIVWLTRRLAGGPVPRGELEREVETMPFGWRTVERAKSALGVHHEKRGSGIVSAFWWSMPRCRP